MRIHNENEVWVVSNPDGMIITPWCSCMAGASGCCNHVIAVLYKVEYANANNFCSSACTSTMWLEQINKKDHRTEKDK